MLTPDLVDVPIEVFGGCCPAVPPADLPPGAANIAQDVQFPQGGVRTRGGLFHYAFLGEDTIPADASINGLKSYLTPALEQRLLVWTSLGQLFKEKPQGTLDLINSRPYDDLFYQSQTYFGREYQAFFNALGGFDIPRQFDDTNWDRVSQVGPGSALGVDNESVSYDIVASPTGCRMFTTPLNIKTISEVGALVTVTMFWFWPDLIPRAGDSFLVNVTAGGGAGYNGTFALSSVLYDFPTNTLTVTYLAPTTGLPGFGPPTVIGTASPPYVYLQTTTASNFAAGSSVTLASVGVGGYNGTWEVLLVGPSLSLGPDTLVVVTTQFNLAGSGGGTISPGGHIDAGLHQVSVAFVTRQGFITQGATPVRWTASGGKRAVVSGIPTGPPNIVARLLLFTPVITAPATTGTFYSLPSVSSDSQYTAMLINDNVTTTLTVDFLDTVLIAGFNANYLFTQRELGECAAMLGYNSRTCWLGERARVPNFTNLSFDGAFNGTLPRGWNWPYGTTASLGGSSALALGYPADWGDAYAIVGDGSAVRGAIAQSAYQDHLGVAIIQANTSYSVRARVRRASGLSHGRLAIILYSATLGGYQQPGLVVPATDLSDEYQEFSGLLMFTPISAPPPDLELHLFAEDTPTNGGVFLVDSVEPFPTNSPFNTSTARFSHAFNPESFDSVTGQVQVRPGDGQQLRAGFPLRNSLYLAKDHYLGYVTDDGINEPSSWGFTEVSATIGICGPNAVDWNEEWAVFAERSGLYICWGGDPVKISPEIQLDASFSGRVSWDSINWAAAHTLWVRIDNVRKMILVGAPINGATAPNMVFMLDYRWLESPEAIASSPMVVYGAISGRIQGNGRGRRWALWNIAANAMCFAERTDGTTQPFFGNGTGNGKVYQQKDCALQPSDDGAAIVSQYQTYATPSHADEQEYGLGAHRKLAGYLKFRAWGAGTLGLGITTAQRSTLLRGYALSSNPVGDGERPLNAQGERFFLSLTTNAAGAWFQLEKLVVCVRKSATALVRGVSA